MFAEDCSVEIGTRRLYVGKAQVSRFFRDVIGQDRSFLVRNEVYNHLQLQMVATVRPDRTHALARSRTLIQGSIDGGPAMVWAEGVYENSFVRVEGEWKIAHMYWTPTFYAKVSGIDSLFFAGAPASAEIPPDRAAPPPDPDLGRHLVPYHFKQPEPTGMG